MIFKEEVKDFLKETNLLLFIDDVKIETLNDFFIHIEIPECDNMLIYEGLESCYKSLIYDKQNRILYLDIENMEKISLDKKEYLTLYKVGDMLHITKREFTKELLSEEDIEYPVFEVNIKQEYNNNFTGSIEMRYSLEQIKPVCVFKRPFNDINTASNETIYFKNIIEKNKNDIKLIQELLDDNTPCMILLEGVLYNLYSFTYSVIILSRVDDNVKLHTMELCDFLCKSFTLIYEGEYIIYDNNVYQNGVIINNENIPKKFKGTYYETMYNFYDIILKSSTEEQFDDLECVRKDIINNYKLLMDTERDEIFNDIIEKGIVFIEKNTAIKFDKQNINYIDSIFEKEI